MAKKTSARAVQTSARQASARQASTKQASAKQASARQAAAPERSNEFFSLPLRTWASTMRRAKNVDVRGGKRAFVFVFGSRDAKAVKKVMNGHLNKWQMQQCLDSEVENQSFQGANGPLWIIRPPVVKSHKHTSTLEKSAYARVRDACGGLVAQLAMYLPEKLIFELYGLSLEEERAVVVGLELASYSFQENRPSGRKPRKKLPALLLKEASVDFNETEIRRAADIAHAMNISRHLVNMPPAECNPRTYAEAVRGLFVGSSTTKVEIWEGQKLRDENMNLLLAVGAAATEGPRLVHISYRPKGSSARPVAIVGKGITFDSGGLDIKPASGMRWMKKDMGGSAACVGLARWAERSELDLPLDIYLSLAENAVSADSFRPGDVIVARNGLTIEISNTDAEGRLVLADALDVAVNQDETPQALINVATLTGAIKVGLGAEVAGLFSNSDELSRQITDAGLAKGDFMWRMPLFQQYRTQLKSNFADMMNSSEGGFGGAITAALFLESFVKDIPWAHLDIYGWRDSAAGAWSEQGGNGQPVQALAEALTRMAHENGATEMA